MEQRFSDVNGEVDYQEVLSLYREQYEEAETVYEEVSAPFATCRYLGTIGNAFIHPEVRAILDLHDEATRALSDEELTLA